MKNKKIFLAIPLLILLISILSGCIGDKKEESTNINSIKTNISSADATIKRQILINGQPFIIKGVGYNPVPIGNSPLDGKKRDYLTKEYIGIYDRDLPLLRKMGTNTIRLWGWDNNADHTDFLNKVYNDGKDPMYVILSFWMSQDADISSPDVRNKFKSDFRKMVAKHKDSPAILMWAVGNELNSKWRNDKNKMDDLFSLIDEMAKEAHLEEGTNYHPVTTTLLDDKTIDTIRYYDPKTPNLDIWGIQAYRGKSFGNLFKDYSNVSSKPLIVMEFGVDAYDNIGQTENQSAQAKYVKSLWNEIASNSNVVIGGAFTTYSDGWWKSMARADCPDKDPSVQGNCGRIMKSFPDDFANDEWWGIVRIKNNGNNPDLVEPREVYYTFQELWTNKK